MRPIGVFDSGIGGLTVARAVADRMTGSPLLYFGDTAHLPYGEKSPVLIRHYASRISHHLRDQGCRAIVVACNSASSNALDAVRDAVGPDIPVVDVVEPVVAHLARQWPGGHIGVIGTRATIESGLYQRLFEAAGLESTARATPLLASAIEEGFHQGAVSEALLEAYLGDGGFDHVDALVLGCTHYPLIADQIAAHLPPHVHVVNSPDLVAEAVAALFPEEVKADAAAEHRFLVSDWTDSFALGARRFFGESIRLEASELWRS